MAASTIKAVGFDLGETLIYYRDTPLSWSSLYLQALRVVATACQATPSVKKLEAASAILSQYNTRITPRTREVPASEILAAVLREWHTDAAALQTAIEAFFSFFQQRMCSYPDAIPALTALRARKVRTGILTDVPYGMPREFVERDLERAGISGLFDVVLTSVDVGVRKPEPVGYIALAERLGVSPREMLYIGNEPKDLAGANAAGAGSVLIDRDGTGKNHGQRFTVSTLPEISALLDG